MVHLSTRLAVGAAKLVLAIVLIACCQIANITAWASDLEDGSAALRKGDFATALKLWQPLAERGNAAAQFNLGMMYKYSEGVAQDYKTAVKWFALAAEQGYVDAQCSLGLMYEDGKGVAQDYKTAVKWYILAAQQGNVAAQATLGWKFYQGEGVAQDYIKAYMWFNIAAIDGDTNKISYRDNVAHKMTTAQLAQAQQLATRCLKSNYKECD